MSPVLPSDFENLRVSPSDSLCTALIKTYIRLPILLYRLMKWLESDEFRNLLAAAYGHPIHASLVWPITTADVKGIIKRPDAEFSLCDRLLSAFGVGNLFYLLVLCWTDEAGGIGECLARNVCGLSGVGGLDAPKNVQATDGVFIDKVVVTWDGVAGAILYDVFRDPHGESQFAVLIGTVAVLTFEDSTAHPGVNYSYWVRARSNVDISALSTPDKGYSDVLITGDLATVLDLEATQGFSEADSSTNSGDSLPIRLMWTGVNHGLPVKWWIYRSTFDDFSTASVIPEFNGVRPQTFMENQFPAAGDLIDNAAAGSDGVFGNAKLLAIIPKIQVPFTGEETVTYFYWVVQKLPNQSITSTQSTGTCAGIMAGCPEFSGSGFTTPTVLESGDEYEIGVLVSQVHVAVFGSGASGAGGGTLISSTGLAGGGGGAAVAWGLIPSVTVGGKLKLVSSLGSVPAGGALENDGNDGALITLQYSADGLYDDTVDLVICGDGQLAGKGLWDATGGTAPSNGPGAGLTTSLTTPLYGNGGETGGAAQSASGKLVQHGGITAFQVRKAGNPGSVAAGMDGQAGAGGNPTKTGGNGSLGRCIIWTA